MILFFLLFLFVYNKSFAFGESNWPSVNCFGKKISLWLVRFLVDFIGGYGDSHKFFFVLGGCVEDKDVVLHPSKIAKNKYFLLHVFNANTFLVLKPSRGRFMIFCHYCFIIS